MALLSTEPFDRVLDRERLDELARLHLLDTPPEEPFDRLTRLAAKALDAPISLVSLVDDHRQFFKSSFGLPQPWSSLRETPLSHSFCRHVVASAAPLAIEDARDHPLVRDNPAVTELGVISYLGVPLSTPGGITLGSFCVISPRAKRWTSDDQVTLSELAASVMSEIALRSANEELQRANARLVREAARREFILAQLRQSEARLCAAQSLARVGSFEIHTHGGRPAYWSAEARRLLGVDEVDPPATTAQFVETLVHPDDRADVNDALERALRQEEPISIEYRAGHLPCFDRILAAVLKRRRRADSADVVDCTAMDVTERCRAEQALAEHRKQLLHVARLATAGEMAAVMAHEINQPLAAIKHTASACSRMIRAGRVTQDDLVGHLSVIARQATRASEVVRRIGSFAAKRPIAHGKVDLVRVVADTVSLMAPIARSEQVILTSRLPSKKVQILGDGIQLSQIVVNLIRNAFDAVSDIAPMQRRVDISLEVLDRRRVMLAVADNGPGVSSDNRSRIFDPFFTTRSNGLGMGLAIAKTIALAHDAAIALGNTRRGLSGARFTVVFNLPVDGA